MATALRRIDIAHAIGYMKEEEEPVSMYGLRALEVGIVIEPQRERVLTGAVAEAVERADPDGRLRARTLGNLVCSVL